MMETLREVTFIEDAGELRVVVKHMAIIHK
jgi:hypothetical protein